MKTLTRVAIAVGIAVIIITIWKGYSDLERLIGLPFLIFAVAMMAIFYMKIR